MDLFNQPAGKNTPAIYFDPASGNLRLKGNCTPENAQAFFDPLFLALSNYMQHARAQTTVDIHLNYINTSSSKMFLRLFKQLYEIHNRSSKVLIRWYYEVGDDDMRDAGSDYEAMIDLPFKLIEENIS